MENIRLELEEAAKQGIRIERGETLIKTEAFPLRTTVSDSDQPGNAALKVQLSAGRKLWIWELQHSLRPDGPIQLLEGHRWSILNAPDGCSWFTSDNPAIQMGLGIDGKRNLGGGWNASGTVLMLPISPVHLLYTEIGARSPEKYSVVSESKFQEMTRIIAVAASRSIFASTCDPEVPKLRPRHVDAEAFRNEKQQWRDWHDHHSDAERFIE
jgi:hypothetical protein